MYERSVMVVVLGGLLIASSCATVSNLETATTLDTGKWQVAIEGRALFTRGALQSEAQFWPAVAVRRGMLDGFELGLRAGGRPEVFAKWRLSKGERVTIALSQTLGVWRWEGNVAQWQSWSRTALPIGIRIKTHELVFSPQVHLALGRADAGVWGFNVTPTASVGFAWWPIPWLGFMPQVSAGFTLANIATTGTTIGGGFLVEAAIAILGGGLTGW